MLSLLLAVPSCTYSFWHGVIPTSYFIFILIFYPGLALTVARGEMILPVCIYALAYTYAHAYCARELNGSYDVYVQS